MAARGGASLARTGRTGQPALNVNLHRRQGCLEKQRLIDRLPQENQNLRESLRRLKPKAAEGPFGSWTPSAKMAVKANTAEEHSAASRKNQKIKMPKSLRPAVGRVGRGSSRAGRILNNRQ